MIVILWVYAYICLLVSVHYFHITKTTASEVESDQSVNKNYKYKFSDNVFKYLKQCKRKVEKAISSKWRAHFKKACLNENIESLYCKHILFCARYYPFCMSADLLSNPTISLLSRDRFLGFFHILKAYYSGRIFSKHNVEIRWCSPKQFSLFPFVEPSIRKCLWSRDLCDHLRPGNFCGWEMIVMMVMISYGADWSQVENGRQCAQRNDKFIKLFFSEKRTNKILRII